MAAEKWTLDLAHSSIDFTVRHLLVSKVRGRFTRWDGVLELDEQNPAASRVEVDIDAASVDTNQPARDAHLRSADFLEAEKHPRITFRSTSVRETGDGHLAVAGDLTIHGTTREVTLDVERNGVVAKDPWGKRRAGFTATATVDRKDFGITYNQTLDQGGLALGEKVAIAIEIEATTSVAAEALAPAQPSA